MKPVFSCLLILLSLCAFAQPAQPDTNLLDKDPVFRKILSRRLKYPFSNAQEGYTKLVYAQFDINQKGHLQSVRILNPAFGRYYFAEFDGVVEKTLKRLPPLNPHYLGKYVLPVMFVLNDSHSGRGIVPDNTNFNGILPEHILLKSVTVIGYRNGPANKKTTQEPGREIYNSSLPIN